MKTIKYIFYILTVILLMSCCGSSVNYRYKYTAEVTYTDSTVDTLTFGRDSFNGNKVSHSLNTDGNTACLVIHCGAYSDPIACGVRKYVILDTKRILIKKKK